MANTTSASNGHRPLLVLDTLAPERQTVLIRTKQDRRGKHYEIATLEDFSLQERAEIARFKQTLDELASNVDAALAGESENADEVLALFEQTLDRFLTLVIREVPQRVLDHLRITQKEQLLDAFTQASPDLARAIQAAREAMTEQTPARRSPGSKGSTAARRTRGSTSSRARS